MNKLNIIEKKDCGIYYLWGYYTEIHNRERRHREDGPAYVGKFGLALSYWTHGKKNRLDGPAIIAKSHYDYYINEELLDEKDYYIKVAK